VRVVEKEQEGSRGFCCLRPEGLKAGWVLWRGQPARASGEHCKLPQQGPEQSLGHSTIFLNSEVSR